MCRVLVHDVLFFKMESTKAKKRIAVEHQKLSIF